MNIHMVRGFAVALILIVLGAFIAFSSLTFTRISLLGEIIMILGLLTAVRVAVVAHLVD